MTVFPFIDTFAHFGSSDCAAAIALSLAVRPAGGDAPWHVLTVAGDGAKAAAALEALGVTVWRPLRKVRVRARRGAVSRLVHRPLFEGYLFVRFGGGMPALAAVLRADGVSGVLGVDGEPKPLRSDVVMALMRLHDKGAFDDSLVAACGKQRLRPGDLVEIKAGPLAGIFATVAEGYAGTRLVRLQAALFGGAAPVKISLDALEKCV